MPCGLLPVFKPVGPSSQALLSLLGRWTRIRHLGHAGTLDPLTDGVLVVAVGDATRIFPYLPKHKAYRAIVALGRTTDTGDAQGRVLEERPVPDFSETVLRRTLRRFEGEILQVPPSVSALKHQGKRLYELARQGKPVFKPARPVTIHQLCLLKWQLPCLTLDIACSGGTYIRSLAEDIGKALECGAYLLRLTRTFCSGFSHTQALGLTQLEAACRNGLWLQRLRPPAGALAHLPAIEIEEFERQRVIHGNSIASRAPATGRVRIMDKQGMLLAMAYEKNGCLVMERVFHFDSPEARACA